MKKIISLMFGLFLSGGLFAGDAVMDAVMDAEYVLPEGVFVPELLEAGRFIMLMNQEDRPVEMLYNIPLLEAVPEKIVQLLDGEGEQVNYVLVLNGNQQNCYLPRANLREMLGRCLEYIDVVVRLRGHLLEMEPALDVCYNFVITLAAIDNLPVELRKRVIRFGLELFCQNVPLGYMTEDRKNTIFDTVSQLFAPFFVDSLVGMIDEAQRDCLVSDVRSVFAIGNRSHDVTIRLRAHDFLFQINNQQIAANVDFEQSEYGIEIATGIQLLAQAPVVPGEPAIDEMIIY